MIYLASPYSDPDPAVRHERFRQVCLHGARMVREGRLVYSPIVHSHLLAEQGLPSDWPFWAEHSRWMLSACRELVVLALPGWKESTGVSAEVELATQLGLPVRIVALEEAA